MVKQGKQPTGIELLVGAKPSRRDTKENVKMVLGPTSNCCKQGPYLANDTAHLGSPRIVQAPLLAGIAASMAIETYKSLARDFPEETANLLLSVSRMLFRMSNDNQPTSTITAPPDEFAAFMPARTIIAANAMMVLSLAFGLATSLVSVVAKIACLLFLLMCDSTLIPEQYEPQPGVLERRMMFLYRVSISTGLATFANLWGAVGK
ncbi:hypothetical protein FRC11_008786 [Ceratobasidium sp. 423]|nr:hypothetical protein FRC11_008786 [Ceratobasidium sp. 423]